MLDKLKGLSESEMAQALMWTLAFAGVCVLVGVGKIKPEVIEMMLMGLLGSMSLFGKKGSQ